MAGVNMRQCLDSNSLQTAALDVTAPLNELAQAPMLLTQLAEKQTRRFPPRRQSE